MRIYQALKRAVHRKLQGRLKGYGVPSKPVLWLWTGIYAVDGALCLATGGSEHNTISGRAGWQASREKAGFGWCLLAAIIDLVMDTFHGQSYVRQVARIEFSEPASDFHAGAGWPVLLPIVVVGFCVLLPCAVLYSILGGIPYPFYKNAHMPPQTSVEQAIEAAAIQATSVKAEVKAAAPEVSESEEAKTAERETEEVKIVTKTVVERP